MVCHKWNSSGIIEVLWTYKNGFFPQWMEAKTAVNLISASSKKTVSLVIVKMIILCCLILSGYVPSSGFLLVNHREERQ